MKGIRYSRRSREPALSWPWPATTTVMFKITTTCSCGAQATLESPTQDGLIKATTAWHDTHPCTKRWENS